MKYLTKEWYKSMQRADMDLTLKVSKKAESFSEKYYNDLYKQEENKWIKLQKEILNAEFEEKFPEYADISILDKNGYKEREKAFVEFAKATSFDLAKEKEQFNKLHKSNIKHLKNELPTEILNKIADIRILALERASITVKKLIADYCKEQNIIVEKALRDYQQYYDKELKDRNDKIIEELYLHDCSIANISKEKDRLIIELDASGGVTDIKAIIFEEYEIIEEEMNFKNGWWLYEEIYITDNKYEIHSLIDGSKDNNHCNLGYFTIKAKYIYFDR